MTGRFMEIVLVPFEIAWWPFRHLGPEWGLALFSVVSGVVILMIYRALVDGAAMRPLNDRLLGSLAETWFARDSLGAILRAQGRVLRLALLKTALQWKALIVLSVFVLWLLAGLQRWCEWRPLQPGETTVLTVLASPAAGPVALVSHDNIEIQTPPVRIPSRGETSWRIALRQPSNGQLCIRDSNSEAFREVVGGRLFQRLQPESPAVGFSGERMAGNIMTIVAYPLREWRCLGLRIGWIWGFCIYALAGAAGLAALRPTCRKYREEYTAHF
jgi:hypothetical protein